MAIKLVIFFVDSQANADSEDMHIDILQVHDNVTPDADQMSFSCKEDSCNSLPTIASDLSPDLIPTPDLQTPSPTSTTAPSNPLDLLWWRDSINLDKANLTLMGFSKGCVVLNQVSKRHIFIKLLDIKLTHFYSLFFSILVYL